MKIIDITAVLGPETAAFPGDQPFTRTFSQTIAQGDVCNLSAITMSPHVGTHVDAPFHYDEHGITMDEVDPSLYIGEVLVVEVHLESDCITVNDLVLDELRGATRVLFKTNTYPNTEVFTETFAGFAPDAVDALAKVGVKLVGIDTPSVDPFHAIGMPAHARFREQGMFILENVRLDAVEPGAYELIALPLRIKGSDGSPVRAILRVHSS